MSFQEFKLRVHLLASLCAGILITAGCQKSESPPGSTVQVVTVRTAQLAPAGFEAWDFVWRGPKRDTNTPLEVTVLQPDGAAYASQTFGGYPAKSENIRSSFSPGFVGGDPKVFHQQTIRLRFHVPRGNISFLPGDSKVFKFRFFNKAPKGDVEWRKPFQTVEAVIEK